jgi:hypothetical protein
MRCEICGGGHQTKHHSDGIEKSVAYMAIITRYYVKEPWHLRECELACALKKPMIACVERGVNWDAYKRFPWVKVVEFDRDRLDMKEIEKELGPALRSLSV